MADFSSAVACSEIHGSRTENGDSNGFKASVKLQCAWADRFTLIDDLISNERTWPGFSAAKAKQTAITPVPGAYTAAGQECVYTDALVTVNYSTRDDEELISESIEPTAEFRRLDHRMFRWGSADGELLSEEEAPGMIVRGMNLLRTMHNVAAVPASILTLPGSCNSAAYTSSLLGLTFAAQTLLFGVNPITRTIKLSGSTGFNVSVKFSFKAAGWNKYWREETKSYENIYEYGGSVYNAFPTASFSDYLY